VSVKLIMHSLVITLTDYKMEERTRVLYRNWATRVSVRWF